MIKKKLLFLSVLYGLGLICRLAAAAICTVKSPSFSQPPPGEILWFFNVGCPACYQVEKKFSRWRLAHAQQIELVPVNFHPEWQPLTAAYYTLVQLGRAKKLLDPFFAAVHQQHIRTLDEQHITDWMVQQGIDRQQWLSTLHGQKTLILQHRGEDLYQHYHIEQIPSFVIDGQYAFDLEMMGKKWRDFPKNIQHLLAENTATCDGQL